jgi:hypothetical protein
VTDIYRVTAPYVVLKSKSDQGGLVALGYYKDALVPESVDLDDLARHIRKGAVEKLDAGEAKAVEKQQAEADKAAEAATAEPDKEGAKAVKKAEADKAAAEKDAAKEDAAAKAEGRVVLKASDSKPGAKTAAAG